MALEQNIAANNFFLKWLKSPLVFMRRGASGSLLYLGDPRVVEPLIQALKDKDAQVRHNAARSLSHCGDKRACDPLFELLSKETIILNRLAIVNALAKLGDVRTVSYLFEVLRHPSIEESFRIQAAYSLTYIKDDKLYDQILASIQDKLEDKRVRLKLVNILGNIGSKRMQIFLETLVNDEDIEIKSQALKSLRHFDNHEAFTILTKHYHLPPPTSDIQNEGSSTYFFSPYADYHQFYFGDFEEDGLEIGDIWTEQAFNDKLAVTSKFIAVSTASYDYVPIEVVLYQQQPPEPELERWSQVVETSLLIPSGKMFVEGCTSAYRPESPFIDLEPGSYAVRIYYSGLEFRSLSDECEDYYKIMLWRAEPKPTTFLKRFQPNNDER